MAVRQANRQLLLLCFSFFLLTERISDVSACLCLSSPASRLLLGRFIMHCQMGREGKGGRKGEEILTERGYKFEMSSRSGVCCWCYFFWGTKWQCSSFKGYMRSCTHNTTHNIQFGRCIFVLFTIHIAISVCLPLFFLAAATFFCQPFDLWELLLLLLCCNFVLEFYVCNVWSI